MTTHAMHLRKPHTAPRHAPRVRRPGWNSIVRFATDHYLMLPAGALLALVWANVWSESYFTMAAALAFPVNEIAMVLFFGLIAQEIFEEMMPGGALHQWRRWVVPIVGAAGGVAGAALVYGWFVNWQLEPMLHSGWPVVAGIDLAFAYFIVKSIFRRHPAVPFLLLLAVASNALGFLAIAPQFLVGDRRAGGAAALMAAAIGFAALLRHFRVHAFWPYLFGAGGLSWLALYVEGFHPGLALVPIVPFLPHARRRLDDFLADTDDKRRDAAALRAHLERPRTGVAPALRPRQRRGHSGRLRQWHVGDPPRLVWRPNDRHPGRRCCRRRLGTSSAGASAMARADGGGRGRLQRIHVLAVLRDGDFSSRTAARGTEARSPAHRHRRAGRTGHRAAAARRQIQPAR